MADDFEWIVLSSCDLGGEDGKPSPEIRRRLEAVCPYPMQLVGEAADAFTRAYNQGIDSRLTAITSKAGWEETFSVKGYSIPKLKSALSADDMCVLLRRLSEGSPGETDDQYIEGINLASSILSTIQVEWV